MRSQTTSRVALLMTALTLLTGCHPTQPFYFHEDGDLSHYLDQATEIEYPDVDTAPLPDASEAREPLTVSNCEFDEMWDIQLEECIQIALQNSKTVRTLSGVTPLGFADGLVGRTGVASSVYDAAITETRPIGIFAEGERSSLGRRVLASQVGGVEAALADFDAHLQVAGSAGGSGEPGTVAFQADRPLNSITDPVNYNTTGGLETALFKRSATGARYTFSNRTLYDRANEDIPPFQQLRSTWSTDFTARIDYPLLRGRGTAINRLPVTLARINTDIALTDFEASIRNLVFDIENTYWDLHLAYRNVETAKIGRDGALVAQKQAEAKLLKNRPGMYSTIPKYEESQARAQYFEFRAQLEQSLERLYSLESRLRWLMGLTATDGRLIRPIDEPTMARVDFDWCTVRTESLVFSPELRQKKWQVKQRELELISAKNQVLPQLDVGAFYRWVGVGDDLITSERRDARFPDPGSTAFQELTSGDYQEAGFIFNFSMPVGFRRALSGVRNAQLELARDKARLEDMELNQVHLLTTAVREADSSYVRAQSNFNQLSALIDEVEGRDKVKELAESNSGYFQLLDAQRRRAIAEVNFYTALTEYNKKIAEVHFFKGTLLEYNNICLAEGPWPQKAYWDALGRARERDASYYLDYGWTRPNVVSRGPLPAGTSQITDMPGAMPTPAEVIPTPRPQPAGDLPGESVLDNPLDQEHSAPNTLPAPSRQPEADAGPITELPAAPVLNAPVIRTSSELPERTAQSPNPLRNRKFDWGNTNLRKSPPQVNELRMDAAVQQATFLGE